MAIDKPANYDRPQTVNDELMIPPLVGQEIELQPGTNEEINIEMLEDGSAVIGEEEQIVADTFDANLAEFISDHDLGIISSDLFEGYQNDKSSRKEWSEAYTKGLDLLGLKYQERSQPWQGASSVTHPLLTEAVTQFQAQAYKELLPGGGPVRTQIIGAITKEKEDQAQRVSDFMNYQIMHVMEEFDPELDQMLFYLPLAGSTFKKVYYDATLGRAVSKFIGADDLVVPYTATDLASSERITHVIKKNENDVKKMQVSGFYRDVDLTMLDEESRIKEKERRIAGVQQVSYSSDQYTLLEIHADLDIPGYENTDGIKLPYIVTIDEGSNKVLSIYRNYKEEDTLFKKEHYFVHYKFMPGLGFYGLGLIHMLGGLSRTATAALRQLVDAGTLANLPAGFKARGLRIKDDDSPLQPGEFRDVDAPGGNLRDGLMPLPYKGADPTLFQLLGFCVQTGKEFATVADQKVGEAAGAGAPVGTTMAILERGMKVMSAIHKRLHYAQKIEFNLLAKVFSDYLPAEYPYMVAGGNNAIKQTDFDDRVDVIPVSDPNIFSMAQRVTLAQTQLQLAQSNPQMHDLREAFVRMYSALGVQNIEKLLPRPPEPQPSDPAMENSGSLNGKKPMAFPEQDHSAHIRAHRAFMSSFLVKQNPAVMNLLQSHIVEHVGFMARNIVQEELAPQMEQVMQENGGQIPPEVQKQLDLNTESAVAMKIAEIIEQMVAEEQEMFDGSQEDPLINLKQQEIDLRKNDLELKAEQMGQKQALDESRLSQKDSVDRERMQSQEDIAQLKANVALDKAEGDRNMDRSERSQDRLLKKEQQRENLAIKKSQMNTTPRGQA